MPSTELKFIKQPYASISTAITDSMTAGAIVFDDTSKVICVNGSVMNGATPIVTIPGTAPNITLDPGFLYVCGTITSLTFALNAPTNTSFAAGYHLIFTADSSFTGVSWPDGLTYMGTTTYPPIDPGATYEIHILNGLCSVGVFGQDFNYYPFTGATQDTAGTTGFVPAPAAGEQDKFLKGDGTWGDASSIGACVIGGYNPSYVNITDSNNNTLIPFSSVPYERLSGHSATITLEPGKIYVAEKLTDLEFYLGTNTYSDYLCIYHIRFESGGTPTNVIWPPNLLFKDGVAPTIDPRKTYEINIIDNLCVVSFYA